MKAAGVSVNCDRRESSAALRRPARDTSAPTTATLKMDLTNIYFPRELLEKTKPFVQSWYRSFFFRGPQMLATLKAIWLLPSLPLGDGITFSFLFFGIIKAQTFLVSDAFTVPLPLYSVSSLGLRHALCI